MITLPIKKQWFDMIASGEKREEYRDLTPYYKRIFDKWIGISVRVRFRNGYRADSPMIEKTVVPHIGCGRPEWGADPTKGYFCLTIMEDGAETIGRAYFKDGETCKRTYIVSCPNFERG